MKAGVRVGLALTAVVAATVGAALFWPRAAPPPPDLPPARGPNPSKVIVTFYSDFQCPVCGRSARESRGIPEEFPGEVRLEFRQFAPAVHKRAEEAAVAALAAHRQGKFWEMHDIMFEHQGDLQPDHLEAYAREAGLDIERYRKDVADPALRQRVKDESDEASRLGGSGTPTIVVNGKVGVGWGSFYVLRQQVEDELKAMNALLAEGKTLDEAHLIRAKQAAKDDATFETYKVAVIDRLAAAVPD